MNWLCVWSEYMKMDTITRYGVIGREARVNTVTNFGVSPEGTSPPGVVSDWPTYPGVGAEP